MALKKEEKAGAWITIAVFLILIYGFGIAVMIKPPGEFSETENRVLKQRPRAEWENVLDGSFEKEYEEYLTDQFVFRNQWIGLKTAVERLAFKGESKDIYFAKDGYLIEKHSGIFTTDLAQRNIRILAEAVERYQDRFGEGHITVMLVPDGVEILREKLPAFASPYRESIYLEQAAALLDHGTVWLDAASVLQTHAEEALYYKTDHHWKTLAAFYVYQAWAEKQGYACPELADYHIRTVTDQFEGTIQSKLGIRTSGDTIEVFLPKQETAYTVSWDGKEERESLYDYGALETKDKYAVYFGGNHSVIRMKTAAGTGRRILVIKDSYANCFIPFMLGEFDGIDVVDLRYTNGKISEMVAEGEYSDLLILYHAAGFAEDPNVGKLLN